MTTKMKKTTDYEAELRQAFKVFDRDNSGTISPDELRHVLESIGDRVTGQELDEMMKEADLDRNGSIDCKIPLCLFFFALFSGVFMCLLFG